MCTAISYNGFFGRNLDYEHSFGERVIITPRRFPFAFRNGMVNDNHYAIIGMGCVAEGYPLYFDATNEYGLSMAGLNFPDNAVYGKKREEGDNVATFELIPWLLCQCKDVAEAQTLLRKIHITGETFSSTLQPTPLHWMIADKTHCLVVESVAEGLKVYNNPLGVLTNNPPFPMQMMHLNNYMGLSNQPPENRFAKDLPLTPYSRGMGALGLPGDLSSASRFVRAAFVKENSLSGRSEAEQVGQFFHVLGAVEQQRGCAEVEKGQFEVTLYSSCCNMETGMYYYTTYENRQITAVNLHEASLDGYGLSQYPLAEKQQIAYQN